VVNSGEDLLGQCGLAGGARHDHSADELGEMLAAAAAELPAWTRERAQQWWQKNLPNLYYTASRVDTVDSGVSTVINV